MRASYSIVVIPVLAAALSLSAASRTSAQNSVKAGMLSCRTSASIGLVVGSRQKLRCRFTPDNGGPPENYVGAINRLGLDLGITAGGVLGWAVFSSTSGVPRGGLAGKYVGGSGDISLGIGVGANALFGGSHNSVALQPLSIEGQVGVNLALGVAGLTLTRAQ
jgi:hypothetical protein